MPVLTYLEAISQALREEMRRDPAVVCLGEDIGAYGGAFKITEGFQQEFGEERVLDTPMAESSIVGMAIGMALRGLRPVAEMQFADFISLAFNQLVNNAATLHYRFGFKVPLVVRCPSGGGVHGGPFHSQNPEGFFFHAAGLKIVAPATAADAKGLLKAAIRDDNPVLYMEHKYLYRRVRDEVPAEDFVVPLGQAAVRRPGRDVTLVGYGSTVGMSLEAAARLATQGLEAEVVDLRSLVPMDLETVLGSVRRTHRAVVTHEDRRRGGIGAEVAAEIAEQALEHLDAPVVRVAALDTPVPFSPPLEQFFLPSAEKIVEAARRVARY
ncbi:MAG TPA: alpha-ketoacid dehydrogenase subunit beta [Candidatus Saccharimonadales bacterium]|nr:alpha-ketoacid dehydrogenase subunit beta [Candidatus Saccharimonadales bacterium]